MLSKVSVIKKPRDYQGLIKKIDKYLTGLPLAGLSTPNMQTICKPTAYQQNRLREYVQRWFIWLHGGLRNRVSDTGGFNSPPFPKLTS